MAGSLLDGRHDKCGGIGPNQLIRYYHRVALRGAVEAVDK
jgi:hypothetical protein